jgi:hypothetical protein
MTLVSLGNQVFLAGGLLLRKHVHRAAPALENIDRPEIGAWSTAITGSTFPRRLPVPYRFSLTCIAVEAAREHKKQIGQTVEILAESG